MLLFRWWEQTRVEVKFRDVNAGLDNAMSLARELGLSECLSEVGVQPFFRVKDHMLVRVRFGLD